MHIKRTYNFLVTKERSEIYGKLRLRVRWDGKNEVAFNLGFRVDPTKWSKDTARCKTNTTHGDKKVSAYIINKKIQEYESFADEVFSRFEAKGIIPTATEYRAEFLPLTGRKVENKEESKEEDKTHKETVLDIYDKFVAEVGRLNNWTAVMHQKIAAMRNKIVAFSPIDFDAFSEEGLTNFIIMLRDEYNMRNSTIARQLWLIKWFIKWAHNKGFHSQTAYLTFSPKLKQSEKRVIFLTWEELMVVYNFNFPSDKQYLARVRDVFCFCCFTSLRYSDVANLKRSDIYKNHIEVTTIKTADSLKIELNDYSREILAKYKDSELQDDLALPVISNQRMNDYLKEMGQMCGIDSPIRETYYIGNERFDEVYPKYALLGTHAGRRTFICNALMLGIAPNIVMKWTGHSDYKAMKPYIDIADSAKAGAMQLFNKH